MSDAIEGVDYIFDRYGFLGLDYNAALNDIKTRIRQKRAENHPDKLHRVSAEIMEIAARQLTLIDECEKVLLSEGMKALYDEKLARFKENEPELVSLKGNPIFNPSRFKIDVDYLLNGQVIDLAQLEEKAIVLSGFSEKKLAKAILRYQQTPENDEREDLREMLTDKLAFCNVMEEYYWQRAGVYGMQNNDDYRLQYAEELMTKFEQTLQSLNFENAILERERASLLGFTQPLLLTMDGVAPENNTMLPQVTQKVLENFELQVEDVKKIIQMKKDTIEQLVKVSRFKQIKTIDSIMHYIFLVEKEEEFGENMNLLGVNFSLNVKTGAMEPLNFDISDLKNIDDVEGNIYIIEPNADIGSPLMEIIALAEDILAKYDLASEQ